MTVDCNELHVILPHEKWCRKGIIRFAIGSFSFIIKWLDSADVDCFNCISACDVDRAVAVDSSDGEGSSGW